MKLGMQAEYFQHSTIPGRLCRPATCEKDSYTLGSETIRVPLCIARRESRGYTGGVFLKDPTSVQVMLKVCVLRLSCLPAVASPSWCGQVRGIAELKGLRSGAHHAYFLGFSSPSRNLYQFYLFQRFDALGFPIVPRSYQLLSLLYSGLQVAKWEP